MRALTASNGSKSKIDQDREARREIRRLERLIDELLDEHGTTLRDEDGIGPISAATLLCETGDSVLYIASVTQQRDTDQARVYLERKTSEGKTKREARRAHKRHLANRVIRRMWRDEQARTGHQSLAA